MPFIESEVSFVCSQVSVSKSYLEPTESKLIVTWFYVSQFDIILLSKPRLLFFHLLFLYTTVILISLTSPSLFILLKFFTSTFFVNTFTCVLAEEFHENYKNCLKEETKR